MARGKKKESALTPAEKLEQALVPGWEQPYMVPKNWCWSRLGSIVVNHDAKRVPLSTAQRSKLSKIYDYYGASGVIDKVDNYIFDEELLLIGEDGANLLSRSTDIAFLANGKYWVNNHAHVLDAKETTTNQFLCNYINHIDLSPFVTGSAQPKLTQEKLNSIPIPLPPKSEQQRIVDRIECLFAKLDEAKEKAQSVLDSFETRKAAILHKAFNGELTANWRSEHGVDLESWTDESLQSVCSMKITDGTHKTPVYCDADVGVPFISAKDVTGEVICWDNIKYIVPELHEELYKRLAPQIDDVLLAKNGTTGVAAIVEEDKIFDLYVTLAVLRPNKQKILPRYLLRVVNSPVCKNQFDAHLTGMGVPNLHLRDIKEVAINVPTLAEQAAIIKIVDSIMSKEQQAKEAAEAVLEKIDLLKKSILARAFRGKLGTNDPTEESALELLKKSI